MNTSPSNNQPSGDTLPILDKSVALETAGGDPELVELLRSTCLQEAPNILEQARTAVSESDWKTARRSGHSLRSSFGAIGALQAQAQSAELEQVEQDDAEQFHSAIEKIEQALKQLSDEVNS